MKKLLHLTLISSFAITNLSFASSLEPEQSKIDSSLDKAYTIFSNYKECVLSKNANACYETGKNVDNIVLKSILVKTACKLGNNQACEEQNKLKEQTKNSCSNSIYDDNCRALVYLSDGNVDTSNWEKYNIVAKEKKAGLSGKTTYKYIQPDEPSLYFIKCYYDYARGKRDLGDLVIGLFKKEEKQLTEQEKKECRIGINYHSHNEEEIKKAIGTNSIIAYHYKDTLEILYNQTKDPSYFFLYTKVRESISENGAVGTRDWIFQKNVLSLCVNDLYMTGCAMLFNPSIITQPAYSYTGLYKNNPERLQKIKNIQALIEGTPPEFRQALADFLNTGYNYDIGWSSMYPSFNSRPKITHFDSEFKELPLKETNFLMMLENAVKNAQVEDLEFFKRFCDSEESKNYKSYCNAYQFKYTTPEQYIQKAGPIYKEINKKYNETLFLTLPDR